MGTLFRQTPNNGYPFPPKWPLKMGTGLEASAAHPRPNNIWVPPSKQHLSTPPPPGSGEDGTSAIFIWPLFWWAKAGNSSVASFLVWGGGGGGGGQAPNVPT